MGAPPGAVRVAEPGDRQAGSGGGNLVLHLMRTPADSNSFPPAQRRSRLLRDHIGGIPIRPVVVMLPAIALFMLAMRRGCSAQRGRWVETWETAELLEPYGEWGGLASVYLLAGYQRGLVPLRSAA